MLNIIEGITKYFLNTAPTCTEFIMGVSESNIDQNTDASENPTGPPTKPHNTQGIALESLSSSQNEQDCSEIFEDILTQVVSCSEEGTHGPTIGLTSCESVTCSLGGVDPPTDLALPVSTLVSKNCCYVRKTIFNCGGCGTILKKTSYCACGTAQEFSSLRRRR